MIKTERGKLEVNGTLGEVRADLCVIVHGIKEMLQEEMSEDEAKEFIFDAVDDGLKDIDEIDEKLDGLIGTLKGLLELLTFKTKGKGEE